MWVKKSRRKTLVQDVFDRSCSLDVVKTLIKNISARSLTLLIFAVGWGLCGQPQPERESVMPLLSLSPLNVLTHDNSVLCQETSSESGLLHTFFICSRAFNNNVIPNGKSYCSNDFYWRPVYTAASIECLRKIHIILGC